MLATSATVGEIRAIAAGKRLNDRSVNVSYASHNSECYHRTPGGLTDVVIQDHHTKEAN